MSSTTKFCVKCGAETERRSGGGCRPCSNAYSAAWRKENRDKSLSGKAAYRIRNKDKIKESAFIYRSKNRDMESARNSAWINNNKDRRAAYRANNSERYRIHGQKRRATVRKSGGTLSYDIVCKMFKLQKGKCACCGLPLGDDFHIDHIMPLALGGSNTDDNIQLLKARCNLQKRAKHPVDFMQQRGFLL
jgi:5-methylcytosine-specific restriction endonuclease McrA